MNESDLLQSFLSYRSITDPGGEKHPTPAPVRPVSPKGVEGMRSPCEGHSLEKLKSSPKS